MIVTTKITPLMKQLILLITLTFFYQAAFSQGVGINTITPDPSAALDIQSSNKGLLVPRVALTSQVDGVTIANPANALLVFNTTNNASLDPGYYYNSGTAATPSWKSLSELTFPFYKASSPAGSAGFQIDNYNGQVNAIAIKGYAAGDGTGVYAQSDNRFALQVEGRLKIFGNSQNPGLGKVLTSDQIGGATWQDVPKLPAVAFRATMSDEEIIPSGPQYKVNFGIVGYDLSNSYNDLNKTPSHSFIVPVKGIYHFDVRIYFAFGDVDSDNKSVSLHLLKTNNGVSTPLAVSRETLDSGIDQLFATPSISADLNLDAGDVVHVEVNHNNGTNSTIQTFSSGSYFNGRLVINL
jgi:hypothetical protein